MSCAERRALERRIEARLDLGARPREVDHEIRALHDHFDSDWQRLAAVLAVVVEHQLTGASYSPSDTFAIPPDPQTGSLALSTSLGSRISVSSRTTSRGVKNSSSAFGLSFEPRYDESA